MFYVYYKSNVVNVLIKRMNCDEHGASSMFIDFLKQLIQ
jgi:hypothetical protein